MLAQFKKYVEDAVLPICVAAGTGALAGSAAGVAAITTAIHQSSEIQDCAVLNSNIVLNSQMIGGLTGLGVGIAIGAVFPATTMLFDWYSARRQRIITAFQDLQQGVQDLELANISRP